MKEKIVGLFNRTIPLVKKNLVKILFFLGVLNGVFLAYAVYMSYTIGHIIFSPEGQVHVQFLKNVDISETILRELRSKQ